jgi:hypothetical protein
MPYIHSACSPTPLHPSLSHTHNFLSFFLPPSLSLAVHTWMLARARILELMKKGVVLSPSLSIGVQELMKDYIHPSIIRTCI